MSKNEQQRQKKLAKKRAKELRGRRELVQKKQQLASLSGQMQAAAEGEVCGCYISAGVRTGMGTVVIARRAPGGRVAIVFFLLDTFCLGVKNAGGRFGTLSDIEEMLGMMGQNEEMLPAAPPTARKLVEDAIEYANSLGLPPHPDYRRVAPIWGDIDASESDEEFTFGREGKPFYVAGPHDDAARQTLIMQRLQQAVGEGNFDFVLASAQMPAGFIADDVEDED